MHGNSLSNNGKIVTDLDELLTGTTYVVPTRRLAHFLRARHDAACQARGLRVWQTPDVVTWPELLRRQFELDRAAGRTAARWLDASHSLIVWEQIVRRDVEMRPVLLPSGLGAVAQRSWELLHAYRIPIRILAEDASPEVQSFARWAAEFGRWLEQGGWLDPAQASSTVGPLATDAPVEFVGFDRLTPAQAAFVERMTPRRACLSPCVRQCPQTVRSTPMSSIATTSMPNSRRPHAGPHNVSGSGRTNDSR